MIGHRVEVVKAPQFATRYVGRQGQVVSDNGDQDIARRYYRVLLDEDETYYFRIDELVILKPSL